MEVIKELKELVKNYDSVTLKLFDHVMNDMTEYYEETLKQQLVDLAITNSDINKKLANNEINEYDAYIERYKLRVEHELVNACIAIIDEDIPSISVYNQVVDDIYGSKAESRLLYDLAKLKR